MRALEWGLLVICVGIVGCGPDIRGQCESQVQCAGGNELDIEACVEVTEVVYDFYVDLGCGDEYDVYIECAEPYLKCRTNPTGQPCATDMPCPGDLTCSNGECVSKSWGIDDEDRDKCEVEAAAYGRCANF